MKDVLDEIVAWKKTEVESFKEAIPPYRIHRLTETMMISESLPLTSMRNALMQSDSGIISEFKRKSPSKGWIKQDGNAADITSAYQSNGAVALSVLTDSKFFGGFDDDIRAARTSGVTIPILYKNFIIDEYQLFMARLCGASTVLLIAAELKKEEMKSLSHTAHELGMEVLLEMHNEKEIEYAEFEPDICGINNRDLGTFITNVDNSFRLAALLPEDTCKVSESGISDAGTVKKLRCAGFNGFLIGENFMKTDNPGYTLKQFIERL